MCMNKRTIVAFDLDGTLTRKDTLLTFIKFAKGERAFYIGFALHLCLLLAYKLRLYPNWKVKQKIFSYFFKGECLADFNASCSNFFQVKGEQLLYASSIEKIRNYQEEGSDVVIISASIENWVRPFADFLGIKQILCTQVEVDASDKLTGRFITKNCYGREKVERLIALFPDREQYYLIAYGDSRGDRELLAYADEKYYKLFKS